MPSSHGTRSGSDSTVRRDHSINGASSPHVQVVDIEITASVSVHNGVSSSEPVLFSPKLFDESTLREHDLVTISAIDSTIDVQDFASAGDSISNTALHSGSKVRSKNGNPKYVCKVRFVPTELTQKLRVQDVSFNKQVASLFGFSTSTKVAIVPASKDEYASTHVEICFRDAYLSRADMWRFANHGLLDQAVFTGQKLNFLGSMKAVVRDIHVGGRRARSAYFSEKTVPVFRSEAARYVIFIQMSREMWDFDSEGDGEIMFNRVVNGFLPELFKRWSSLELRHLVSIVMFGRLEYKRSDFLKNSGTTPAEQSKQLPLSTAMQTVDHQDFYRVVVTDMASAQWTMILEELKKGFRVFLRDVCLFKPPKSATQFSLAESQHEEMVAPAQISGRLSGSLKGNILEAISLAASQFSNDYVDRDLIRTGISTVVITPGAGVFDVDRDLLRLTSETLTNNGIGIDIVCLSKMPLHSVPLFRYRFDGGRDDHSINGMKDSLSPASFTARIRHPSLPDLSSSPAFSYKSPAQSYFSRFPAAYSPRLPLQHGYGIPQWVDLSYWSPKTTTHRANSQISRKKTYDFTARNTYIPRVRMYELQMMGLMELGMADIWVPFLSEEKERGSPTLFKWNSRLSDNQYGASFSHSPETVRKSPFAIAMSNPRSSQRPRENEAVLHSAQAMMDEYDDKIFKSPPSSKRRKSRRPVSPKAKAETMPRAVVEPNKAPASLLSSESVESSPRASIDAESRADTISIASDRTALSRPARAPRNFSYSLKGLMPFKATAAKAQVQTQNVNAFTLATPAVDETEDVQRPQMSARPKTSSYFPKQRTTGDTLESTSRPSTGYRSDDASKPIKIAAHNANVASDVNSITKHLWQQRRHQRNQSELSKVNTTDESDVESDSNNHEQAQITRLTPSSIPESKIPFVRNVNASNPLKRKSRIGTFGRWQHLYPRKPKFAKVKWRSLCTPASVPLTTDDFPTRDALLNDYEGVCHTVSLKPRHGDHEVSRKDLQILFLEMVSLRIAHGYQFVVGSKVRRALDEEVSHYQLISDPTSTDYPDLSIVLAMGNTIQKLDLGLAQAVRVTKYVQKTDNGDRWTSPMVSYRPYLRTILANDYFPRSMTFRGFSESYRWDMADNHLAGSEIEISNPVRELRYWRARFVLIPVEPPSNTWKKLLADESEEEVHLLGIRALTQIWQKNRFMLHSERQMLQKDSNLARARDDNPLEVNMETLNTSELINLELDRLTQMDNNEVTSLLPETQKLDRETPITKIAQALQGEHGIDIRTRRWHWRLHYHTFRGEDLTTWLTQNVKNLGNRNEALKYGNDLMKEGLFEHAQGRHAFKDGHYFYSIRQQYRQPRNDLSKSWFSLGRASDKSVPATPATEYPSKELSPAPSRTRSGSNLAHHLHTPSSDHHLLNERPRKNVTLSRKIKIDVDPKKKSLHGRPETINVHYDRFHNPENCYHIWIDWLSTTCKLVDDAIVSWTNTVEKYGLKLVEVPIAEAVSVPESEPFRNPYRIKLAADPPKVKSGQVMFNTVFTSTSFSPQAPAHLANADKHIYQKALLKRCNFVLDLEATHEYPPSVDIDYSWGKLNYENTQYVHRSGVVLAQIMHNGDISLLANRLYNSRLSSTKDIQSRKMESSKDVGPQAHRPAVPPSVGSMQPSGIVGVNLASPSTKTVSSPGLRAIPNLGSLALNSPSLLDLNADQNTLNGSNSDNGKLPMADVLGSRPPQTLSAYWNALITPEQIKNDLEAFCQDKNRLEAFYREVGNTLLTMQTVSGMGSRKATGSSSSSLLRPVKEVSGTSDIMGIPAFELPEPISAVRELRRATVAYESMSEMFDRSKPGSRSGSIGSNGHGDSEVSGVSRSQQGIGISSPLRKPSE